MHDKSIALIAALITWVAAPAFAQILPSGPAVVSGNASFATAGNVLTVTNSNGAIINWQSFNIGAGNTTNFAQPSASSAVLNRVLDASASVINGMLSSNGRVFLVNPNGLLFGSTSQVNVGGLVASTANITDANFQSGNLQFVGAGAPGAITINGSVTVPGDGYIVLLAPTITIAGNVSVGGFFGADIGSASSLIGSAASITGIISGSNSGNGSVSIDGSITSNSGLIISGPIGLGTGTQVLIPTGPLTFTGSGSNTGNGSTLTAKGFESNTSNGSNTTVNGTPVAVSTGQVTLAGQLAFGNSGFNTGNGLILTNAGTAAPIPTGQITLAGSGSYTGSGSIITVAGTSGSISTGQLALAGSGSNTVNGSISIGTGTPVQPSTGRVALPASVELTRSTVAGGTIALTDGKVSSDVASNTNSPVVSAPGPTSIALVLVKRDSAF